MGSGRFPKFIINYLNYTLYLCNCKLDNSDGPLFLFGSKGLGAAAAVAEIAIRLINFTFPENRCFLTAAPHLKFGVVRKALKSFRSVLSHMDWRRVTILTKVCQGLKR